jgi:hypothetical protein
VLREVHRMNTELRLNLVLRQEGQRQLFLNDLEVCHFIILYLDSAKYLSGLTHILSLFRRVVCIMSHLTTLSISESIQRRATVISESEKTSKEAVLVKFEMSFSSGCLVAPMKTQEP